ncbi:S41 family peptidase [Candidatus Falkowbacteria bacterium]|nr:S41 family peptidase [Candidatus Falkowbacteria bacterium]
MLANNPFKKYVAGYIVVLLVALGFLGGFWLGQTLPWTHRDGSLVNVPVAGDKPEYLTERVDFNLFNEVWGEIAGQFVDRSKLLDSELFYGSLRGLVAALNDPYSAFFDPQETRDFSQELEGNFEGIGAEITIKQGQLMVVAPLPGSPAYTAGLQPGDLILAIDSEPTAPLTLYQAVDKIRGQAGTAVTLVIARTGWTEPKEITMTRQEIHFDSVRWHRRDDGLFYIEVNSFNDDTRRLFNQAVRDVVAAEPQGIILDLRGNPGGYLDYAVDMVSEWVENEPVVIEQEYDGQTRPYMAQGVARLKDYPTVVLVNVGSASSAEIVAGALQDYGKAKLVGVKTFGKGSVQELKMLSNGSAVKLTVARWLTPKGRQIDQQGIEPDISVDRTQADYDAEQDPQLDRAVEVLRSVQ